MSHRPSGEPAYAPLRRSEELVLATRLGIRRLFVAFSPAPPTVATGGTLRTSRLLGRGPDRRPRNDGPRSTGPSSLRPGVGVLCAAALLAACRGTPAPPPVDAVQEAFRTEALDARESRGKQLFAERCATCHGPAGRGDGQNAYNLQPPPPDFSESLAGLPVPDRRRVIEEGTTALGRSPLCPPRGTALDDDAVEALLAYLDVMARQLPDEEARPAPGRRRWRRPR